MSALVMLRKLYSIGAFSLLGFVVHLALPRSRREALRAALIVAVFSALIEIAQKLHGAHEGVLSNVVDIACGALGGWLGVTIARDLKRR
jgi:glycopeptide antibiotics resistance protein